MPRKRSERRITSLRFICNLPFTLRSLPPTPLSLTFVLAVTPCWLRCMAATFFTLARAAVLFVICVVLVEADVFVSGAFTALLLERQAVSVSATRAMYR